ncbi:MAG: SDR family oxidoreductase [Candidatus Methylomirabilia bacterium]
MTNQATNPRRVLKEAEGELLRDVPLRRAGLLEGVANLVVFLASELSTYITGTTIAIDGGTTRTI